MDKYDYIKYDYINIMKAARISFFIYLICTYIPLLLMYSFPDMKYYVGDQLMVLLLMLSFAGAVILFPAHLFFLFKNLKAIHQKDSLSALYYFVDVITLLVVIGTITVVLFLAKAYA